MNSEFFCPNVFARNEKQGHHYRMKKVARSGRRKSLIKSPDQCDQIGRFLHFGQLFKGGGNNYFAQIARPHYYAIFVTVSKFVIFLVQTFLGNFYSIWRLFTGHTGLLPTYLMMSIINQRRQWTKKLSEILFRAAPIDLNFQRKKFLDLIFKKFRPPPSCYG